MSLRPHRDGAAAIALATAITAYGALPVWMLSAFAPAITKELSFDKTSLGVIIGAFFALSALLGLPIGRLVHHWGWRTSIAFSCAVASLCMVVVALLSQSWASLLLAVSIGAVSNISSQPASNLAIASSVPEHRHGLAYGLKQAGLPISTLLVGLVVPFFDQGRGWRPAFLVFAAIGLVLAASAIRPTLVGWVRGQRLSDPSRPVVPAGQARVRYPVPRSLILLAIGAGFGTAACTSLGGFIVVYAVHQGMSPGSAARVLAAGSIAGIVGRIGSGVLSDRWGGHPMIWVAVMMGGGCLGFLILATTGTDPVGIVAGTILAFGLGWSWNGLLQLSVVRYSPIPPAVSTSVAQTAISLGSASGPVLVGTVSAWSFTAAWYAAMVILATAATLVVLGKRATGR